jgi:hypothetical protein
MVKKTINPKVVIHLSISQDLKQFLIDNNINASELFEKAISELMNITKNEKKEDVMEYYPDIKKMLENERILAVPYQFEDRAFFREKQIQALNILRHRLGFNLDDAKKILDKYIKEKEKEIKEISKERYRDF